MKALVTGAAGFIGQKVAELLLNRGYQVIGIDNINDYYDITLKKIRLDALLKHINFSFHKLDICDNQGLRSIFIDHKFDVVYHLAAMAGVRYSISNPTLYLKTNVEGTLNLLEYMRHYKIPKMVLSSTSSLYAGLPIPFTEDQPVNTPISPYAASKKAAECYAYTYHKLYGIDVSILRYFTVYGPLGRPDMAPYRFCKWILEDKVLQINGDGEQRRDFTYVDDIANGTILAEKPLGYEIINLGGGKEPITINKFIKEIEEITNRKAKIKYNPFHQADMVETLADISKAKQILGWSPKISITEGIKEMLRDREYFKFSEK